MDKFDWECWEHYGIEQKFRKIGNKIDEIIDNMNMLDNEKVKRKCLTKEE